MQAQAVKELLTILARPLPSVQPLLHKVKASAVAHSARLIVRSADPSQGHQGCPLHVKLPVYLPARQRTLLEERFRGFPDTQSP